MRGFYGKIYDLANCLNGAFMNGVCVAVSVGKMDLKKYDLKPYRLKSVLIVYEGLYYEDQILYWGGVTIMIKFKKWMNCAHMNGIYHAIVQNS